jgi:hypothetical protein
MSTDMLSYGLVELTRAEASKISGGLILLSPLGVFGVIAAGAYIGVAATIVAATCAGLGVDWLVKRFHH